MNSEHNELFIVNSRGGHDGRDYVIPKALHWFEFCRSARGILTQSFPFGVATVQSGSKSECLGRQTQNRPIILHDETLSLTSLNRMRNNVC